MTGSIKDHITSSSTSIVMLHMNEESFKGEFPPRAGSVGIFLNGDVLGG